MPSGAKKRKAAKKKKENPQLPNPASATSSTHTLDGDDVKHHEDKESDVGEVSSPASQDPHSHENPLSEGEEGENKREVEEGSVVLVERESNEKNGKRENGGGSSGSSSSSSSSSSSDDESHDIKISQAVVDVSPVVDSVKADESLSGATAEAVHSAEIEQPGKTVVEISPTVGSEKIEASEIHITTRDDNSVVYDVVESISQENGEKELSAGEGHVGISSPIVSVEGTVQSVEYSAQRVDPKVDDKLSLSYSAPGATDDKRAEHEKDSGVTQPLLAPASHAAQTTSWKSCCGLFELFSGSDR